MSASFCTLRDYHVGTCFKRLTRLLDGMHLADQSSPCLVYCGGERTRITKREHDSRWLTRQNSV